MESGSRRSASTRGAHSCASIRTVCSGCLLPVGKSELRAAGTATLDGGRVHADWKWSSSSGSTGEPFRVYYEPRAWATLKHLVKLRARMACGVRVTDRVALLDATPPSQDRGRVGPLSRVARVSVLQPAETIADQLRCLRARRDLWLAVGAAGGSIGAP